MHIATNYKHKFLLFSIPFMVSSQQLRNWFNTIKLGWFIVHIKGLQVRIPKILPSMQSASFDTYAYAQMSVIDVYAGVSSRARWLLFGRSLHLLPYFIWEH